MVLAVVAWLVAGLSAFFALREAGARGAAGEVELRVDSATPVAELFESAERARDLAMRSRQSLLTVSLWSRLSLAVGTLAAVLSAIGTLSGTGSTVAILAAFGGGLVGFGIGMQAGRVVRKRSRRLEASAARVTRELKRRAGLSAFSEKRRVDPAAPAS